jgi:hypothetical protein
MRMQWLYANKAAREGTQIHLCLEQLSMGVDIDFDSKYFDPDTQEVKRVDQSYDKVYGKWKQVFLRPHHTNRG